MIQFEYDGVMKRYDVKVPQTIAGESSMLTIAHISEDNKIILLRELRIEFVRQILMHWDEYEHQMTRELQDMLDDDSDNKHESIWINDRLAYLVERLQLSSWKDISIDQIEITCRAWNILAAAGIRTIGKLTEKSATDLRRLKNCGRVTLTEIECVLEELGLTLKQTNNRRLKFH